MEEMDKGFRCIPMNDSSVLLFEKSKKIVPGGVHSPVRSFRGVEGSPIFMESAQGVMLTSVDQKNYIDYCLSWGPLILGHRDIDVENEIIKSVQRGWSYGTAEPYSLMLAEFITKEIPWVEKIRFVNSGTEAVMSALRVARAATGKSKIIKFDGCYHGHVDSMLVRAGSGLADMSSPDSAGVSQATASETLVAPLGNISALEEIIHLHKNEIAALIIEPLPANNGLLLQNETFLKEISTLCKKNNILLIFDEVISGFRTGFTGMAGKLGIEPDLTTYGKIIGGGFPVGAFGGKKEWMNLVAPEGAVYQAGTLSGNPIAMTAGFTTLKKLKETNPYSELATKTKVLAESLNSIKFPLPSKTFYRDSLFWTVFGEIQTKNKSMCSPCDFPMDHKKNYIHFFHKALENGLYFAPSAFEVGFLSTQHTETHIQESIQKIKEIAQSFQT